MPTPTPAVVTLASCPVAYSILYDPRPTLKGDEGGWTATLAFKVAMADVFTFCSWAAGTPTLYDLGGGVTATRIVPLSHPENTKLLCRGIDATAKGGWTPGNPVWDRQWSAASVVLTFKSVPYATDGSAPFMVTETRTGSETYTLAGTRLAFADATPIQADAGLNVPVLTYSTTVYQAAALGDDVVAPLTGKVNSSTVQLGDYVCPVGTVRFDGMQSRLSTTATFQKAYERGLMFAFRRYPWNQFLKPTGVWDYAQKPDSSYVYESANLNLLLA